MDTRSKWLRSFVSTRDGVIASAALLAILWYLLARFIFDLQGIIADSALIIVVVIGGLPLLLHVLKEAIRTRGGADTLAAVSIITAVLLGDWLIAAIIVLMLSGGEALEEAATRRATGTLDALARRAPTTAHKVNPETSGIIDINVADIAIGDEILVLPHELCPVDGEVTSGHGQMDESFLTGEPYLLPKSPGSLVISGAINGDAALSITATALAEDSRYAQIVGVLAEAEDNRPKMRRLADRLGAWYTVIALSLGVLGWVISHEPTRFLAVVVVATPCPLLIGVPVAIIGAISLAARRGIIIKNPAILEQTSAIRSVLFDKTGTLTYGRPVISAIYPAQGFDTKEVLRFAAAAEQYSRHPLAHAIITGAGDMLLPTVHELSERPGAGLQAIVDGHELVLTNRKKLSELDPSAVLPDNDAGLETVVLIDGSFAGLIQLRDEPRATAADFIAHLPNNHNVQQLALITGDRESEARYLAAKVGIDEVHAGISPEGKLAIVEKQNKLGTTVFLGDGINDAPAMAAATIGVAMGTSSDITAEAADAVILDSSLERLDELLHIGSRMRRIALQSAVGGMLLSTIGMVLAVFGLLTPLAGAIAQEVMDVLAILNAARVGAVKRPLSDF